MIGISWFLTWLFLALGCLGASLALAWRQTRGQGRERSVLNIALCVFFGFFGASMILNTVLNVVFMLNLRALRADDIEAVAIGDTRISDRQAIADIAPCFTEATWFNGIRRARLGRELRPFEIVRRGGTREEWGIAALGDGAAIDFGAPKFPLLRPARGWAYVACLPEKLREHDVDLLRRPTPR